MSNPDEVLAVLKTLRATKKSRKTEAARQTNRLSDCLGSLAALQKIGVDVQQIVSKFAVAPTEMSEFLMQQFTAMWDVERFEDTFGGILSGEGRLRVHVLVDVQGHGSLARPMFYTVLHLDNRGECVPNGTVAVFLHEDNAEANRTVSPLPAPRRCSPTKPDHNTDPIPAWVQILALGNYSDNRLTWDMCVPGAAELVAAVREAVAKVDPFLAGSEDGDVPDD